MKRTIFLFLLVFPLVANAQWRIGVTGGVDYNKYTSDEHYLTDLYNEGEWGKTFGVACQYDIMEWQWCRSKIGVRSEVNYVDKCIRTLKGHPEMIIFTKYRSYIQLPVMANYSLGNEKMRAFVNIGGYCGWRISGKEDEWQRIFDIGCIGGLGAEYNFKHITFQAEARCYASGRSATKSDRRFETPHYNTTLVFQLALFYNL